MIALYFGEAIIMKDYRKEELKSYVIGNILFILTLSGVFDPVLSKNIKDLIDVAHLILESTLLSSILYIYIYIIDSMIPSSLKDKISYFPFNKPGMVVFIKIKSNGILYRDDRFTVDDANRKYEEIYIGIDQITQKLKVAKDNKQKRDLKKQLKMYQNSKWFDIYMQHKDDLAVSAIQKDSLLNRDINVITVSILVLYMITCFCTSAIKLNGTIIYLLLAEFVVTSIAAKSRAKRFVLTVISRDIYNQ